jgi:hypothetical protein
MRISTVLQSMRAAAFIATVGLVGTVASASVTSVNFESSESIENTGVTCDGSVSYDDTANLLTLTLSNTSGFQSVITGFYFNISGDASATYDATNDPATSGVDESAFAFETALPPFGSFDAGAKLQNLSQQQVRGIDEGETGSFTFNISGADADLLKAINFLTDINSGGGLTGALAVRYQSVGPNAQLSDKVIGVSVGGEEPPPHAIPLPPAVGAALVSMAIPALGSLRRRFRRA